MEPVEKDQYLSSPVGIRGIVDVAHGTLNNQITQIISVDI